MRRIFFICFGFIILLLIGLYFYKYKFQQNSSITSSSTSSACTDIPNDVSVSKFDYAYDVPAKREITTSGTQYSFKDRLTAYHLSINLPFNTAPKITKGSILTMVSLGDKRITIGPAAIEDFKIVFASTTCTSLKTELNQWWQRKSDYEIAKELAYLTPASQSSMSHNLFFTLLGAKELLYFSHSSYDVPSSQWLLFQYGNPTKDIGVRVDIYNRDGSQVSNIIFTHMSQDEIDYVMASLKSA